MESKTIRVRVPLKRGYTPNDYYTLHPEGAAILTIYLTVEQRLALDGRDLDVVITPIASPEERLREARIAAVQGAIHPMALRYGEAVVDAIERVDAEFAKSTPRE